MDTEIGRTTPTQFSEVNTADESVPSSCVLTPFFCCVPGGEPKDGKYVGFRSTGTSDGFPGTWNFCCLGRDRCDLSGTVPRSRRRDFERTMAVSRSRSEVGK